MRFDRDENEFQRFKREIQPLNQLDLLDPYECLEFASKWFKRSVIMELEKPVDYPLYELGPETVRVQMTSACPRRCGHELRPVCNPAGIQVK